MRHKVLLVTVTEWLKSVLNYRSYPKINLGIHFLYHPVGGARAWMFKLISQCRSLLLVFLHGCVICCKLL